MAAVTSQLFTGATVVRRPEELLETIAVTNAAATTTVARAFATPAWARSVTFVLDITITGTTPLFDLAFYQGASRDNVRYGSTLDSTTDIVQFPTHAAITQLNTDGSSPTVAINIGPDLPLDSTGSATADSSYSFPGYLPPYFIYIYTYDGTTADEDYNGTLTAFWHK